MSSRPGNADEGADREERRLNQPPEEGSAYPVARGFLPPQEISQGDYVARFARTAEELDTLLRLRFEVFNVELGEGLFESWESGLDRDRFDDVCHHAVVASRAEGRLVGTIRIQTHSMADRAFGFYSDTEFDLGVLPDAVLKDAVEMGRACILKSHRNKQVLFLLWKALALYMQHNRQRHLFGCCSLASQDPADGQAALRRFEDGGFMHDHHLVSARPGYECPPATPSERPVEIPTLFKTYLRYGAKVCSGPAIDRSFKTIDFFLLFDLKDLTPAKRRMFFR